MNYEKVKDFCEQHNYTSRKDMYKIMEHYFGVGAGTCKEIISFDRQLRNVLPVDEVGIKKAKEYETPDYMRSWENELNSLNIKYDQQNRTRIL